LNINKNSRLFPTQIYIYKFPFLSFTLKTGY
jgi:hypothetical protein